MGSGMGHTRSPRPGKEAPHAPPVYKAEARRLASLLLYSSYSSTSACFPSSALPFNRMSLSSGDMK